MARRRRDQRAIADAAYEAVAARNASRIAAIEDVRDEIKATLPAADQGVLWEEYCMTLAREADTRATDRAASLQLDLFSGKPDALEGYFPLGDGKRVKVKAALQADWITHLQFKSDHLVEAQSAYLNWLGQHNKLLPYLLGGHTTAEAIGMYQRDHPSSGQTAAP